MQRLEESDRLFLNTLQRDEEAVAAQIEKVHAEETSPIHYNREESLRSVIKLAYYTYRDNYLQWEELPAGVGYADIVYLPKRSSGWPALVIELKWNESAEGAIEQIRKKRYPDALKGYGGEVLLVGINYDRFHKAPLSKAPFQFIKNLIEWSAFSGKGLFITVLELHVEFCLCHGIYCLWSCRDR